MWGGKEHFGRSSFQTGQTDNMVVTLPCNSSFLLALDHLRGLFDLPLFSWWICMHVLKCCKFFFAEIRGGVVRGVPAGDTDRLFGWWLCENAVICLTGFERWRSMNPVVYVSIVSAEGPLLSCCILGYVLKQWVLLFYWDVLFFTQGVLICMFSGVICLLWSAVWDIHLIPLLGSKDCHEYCTFWELTGIFKTCGSSLLPSLSFPFLFST